MALKPIAAILIPAALLWPGDALAQRSKFDGLRQCERFAAAQLRKRIPLFRRFLINRASVNADPFAEHIGTQYVSTVYHGRAMLETLTERNVRFVCLHSGSRRGPVFVYTMPE